MGLGELDEDEEGVGADDGADRGWMGDGGSDDEDDVDEDAEMVRVAVGFVEEEDAHEETSELSSEAVVDDSTSTTFSFSVGDNSQWGASIINESGSGEQERRGLLDAMRARGPSPGGAPTKSAPRGTTNERLISSSSAFRFNEIEGLLEREEDSATGL